MKLKEKPFQPIRLNPVKRPGLSSTYKILLNIAILLIIIAIALVSFYLLGFFGWEF